MKLILLFVGLTTTSWCISQGGNKPPIDSLAIRNWDKLGTGSNDDVAISNDGNNYSYVYSKNGVTNRILQLKNGKTYSFPASVKYLFSADSKYFIYFTGSTITSMEIESGQKKAITGVRSMQYPESQKGRILVYQLEGNNRELVIENLLKEEKKKYPMSVILRLISRENR